MKTEVYSWRLSRERKADLESEARREGISLSRLLDEITGTWLKERRSSRNGDEAEQAAIRRRVMKTVGTIKGGDPTLSTRAREIVRQRILEKYLEERRRAGRPD